MKTEQELFETWNHNACLRGEDTGAWAAWKARSDIAQRREKRLTEVLLDRVDVLLSALEEEQAFSDRSESIFRIDP